MKKILLILSLLSTVLIAGGYWVEYGESKSGRQLYRVVNESNQYIYCEAIGEYYYYKEFGVSAGKKSRPYPVPNERFNVTCR